ncbi:DUF4177 domain-containing protein [Haloarcula nitratireducens]|uniref:DUF4177 domain-containing protein n=1 Tax=Haloarcula nitratireducens TaxID=2487749 RepID=A0AAW4PE44_9EURY|nr:DUF4177 domain-containing protein [Halomicroarcula nitratireducens]MBX0296221.1 DUF4177 domain-containing protein [Halomicroarcula nitratireducens]
MTDRERTRWEYETLQVPKGVTQKESVDPKSQLNELGREGWELAGTVAYTGGGGTKFLLFKRPAESDDDAEQ